MEAGRVVKGRWKRQGQVRENASQWVSEVGATFVMGDRGKKGGGRARKQSSYRARLASVAGRGQQRRGNGSVRRRQEERRGLQQQWQAEQAMRGEEEKPSEEEAEAIVGTVRAMVDDMEALYRWVEMQGCRRVVWEWRKGREGWVRRRASVRILTPIELPLSRLRRPESADGTWKCSLRQRKLLENDAEKGKAFSKRVHM